METLETSSATSAFTAELWESIIPIYRAILGHPFLEGLADGSLPEESFRFYVTQDSLYLRDYSRCLGAAAVKAPEDRWREMFLAHARNALVVERLLHEGFFAAWGMSPEAVRMAPMAPTNLAYSSYLARVAHFGSFEELMGAVLPCYWIYWEVGKDLETRGSSNPLYQRWIDTYASEEFATAVQEVLAAMDEAATDMSPSRREQIRGHFVTASRYEWMFWDAAYRLEAWPV